MEIESVLGKFGRLVGAAFLASGIPVTPFPLGDSLQTVVVAEIIAVDTQQSI
jgi:hypothetical protein